MSEATSWKNNTPRWIRTPAFLADVELAEPLEPLRIPVGHRAARLLVRIHGRPIGYADITEQLSLPIDRARIIAALDAAAVERALRHLSHDLDVRSSSVTPQLNLAMALDLTTGLACPQALPTDGPLATVAICTRDRTHSLGATLDSLLRQSYHSFEILLVDNAPSNDATEQLVREHYPDVRYVREDRAGLDWARNRAIAEARGEFIAYIDDDAIADPRWLAALIDAFDTPEVMCVTGLVVPARLATPAQELFERFGFSMSFERQHFNLHMQSPRPGFPFKGFTGTGCNSAFRRTIFDRIGLFDVCLDVGTPVPGGGDLDIFARVIRAGYTLFYDPAPIMFHDHIADMDRLIDKIGQYHTANIAYLTKHILCDREYAPMLLRYLCWTYLRTLIRGAGSAILRGDRPLVMVLNQATRSWLGPIALYRSHHQRRIRENNACRGAADHVITAGPK
jgi:glycosyltransferase involved in cell wall biosynthesis